jgi:hypothetical protein
MARCTTYFRLVRFEFPVVENSFDDPPVERRRMIVPSFGCFPDSKTSESKKLLPVSQFVMNAFFLSSLRMSGGGAGVYIYREMFRERIYTQKESIRQIERERERGGEREGEREREREREQRQNDRE